MAVENIFTKAKRYQKLHPKTAWQDCIKHVSKKGAKVGKVKIAKSVVPVKAVRKIKVKIKPGKKGTSSITIGSINKMHDEHKHVLALEQAMNTHKELLKNKALTVKEKADIRRDIKRYQNNIKASKQHITALKRSI